MYHNQDEELFLLNLKTQVSLAVEKSPAATWKLFTGNAMTTKESVTTKYARHGFGLMQRRPVGTPAPMQEEVIKKKKFRWSRYSLGYTIPIHTSFHDPHNLAAEKSDLLAASQVLTMNYEAQTAMLRMVSGASNAITSIHDGLSIFNASHPAGGAVQSNLLTQAMTPDGLIASLQILRAQANPEGMPVTAQRKNLVLCSTKKSIEMEAIVSSTLKAGTNNNDINVLRDKIEVIPLEWWGLAGSAVESDYAIIPADLDYSPLNLIQMQPYLVGMDTNNKTGLKDVVASVEFGFDGFSHIGSVYSNVA